MLKHFLKAWQGETLELTLDTSMLWGQYCLIEVCLIWGGRSISLAQTVLSHGSATVGFEQYRLLLETVVKVLPDNCAVTLLADRGFEHGAIMPLATPASLVLVHSGQIGPASDLGYG